MINHGDTKTQRKSIKHSINSLRDSVSQWLGIE